MYSAQITPVFYVCVGMLNHNKKAANWLSKWKSRFRACMEASKANRKWNDQFLDHPSLLWITSPRAEGFRQRYRIYMIQCWRHCPTYLVEAPPSPPVNHLCPLVNWSVTVILNVSIDMIISILNLGINSCYWVLVCNYLT